MYNKQEINAHQCTIMKSENTSSITQDHSFLSLMEPNILRDSTSLALLQSIDVMQEGFDEIVRNLNKKTDRLDWSGLSVSYRKLVNWQEEGLVSPEKESNGKWRRYSIIDLVWLSCINIARNSGLPIDLLRNGKNTLQIPISGIPLPFEYPQLEFYILRYLFYSGKYVLLIMQDGKSIPLSLEEYILYIQEYDFERDSHFIIDLTNIFLKVLPRSPIKIYPPNKRYVGLSTEQILALTHLQMSSNVKEVTFKKGKNGKLAKAMVTKIFKATDVKPSDLLREGGDQVVTTIQDRGHRSLQQKKTHNLSQEQRRKSPGSKNRPE